MEKIKVIEIKAEDLPKEFLDLIENISETKTETEKYKSIELEKLDTSRKIINDLLLINLKTLMKFALKTRDLKRSESFTADIRKAIDNFNDSIRDITDKMEKEMK